MCSPREKWGWRWWTSSGRAAHQPPLDPPEFRKRVALWCGRWFLISGWLSWWWVATRLSPVVMVTSLGATRRGSAPTPPKAASALSGEFFRSVLSYSLTEYKNIIYSNLFILFHLILKKKMINIHHIPKINHHWNWNIWDLIFK